MRTITCLDCEQQFSGETKEAIMQAMMPHYMADHKDVMEAGNEEKKKVWFQEFGQRWEAASEE